MITSCVRIMNGDRQMKARYVVGAVAVGILVGRYAAQSFRRYQYGKAAPAKFAADQKRNQAYNDQWLLDIEAAICVGKPLEEFPSWTVGGSSKELRQRFAAAVRAYDQAVGRI